jgi:hypothetical protein
MRRLSILVLVTTVAGVISASDCARGGKVDPNDPARSDSSTRANQDSAGKTDTTKHATVPTTPPK